MTETSDNSPPYAYCNRCEDSRKLCDDDGYYITIKDAIGLMKTKFPVEPDKGESEEQTRAIGNGIILVKVNNLICEVGEIKEKLREQKFEIVYSRGAIGDVAVELKSVVNNIAAIKTETWENGEVIKSVASMIEELSNNTSETIEEHHRQLCNRDYKKAKYLSVLTYMFVIANIALFALICTTTKLPNYVMMVFVVITAVFLWSSFIFLRIKDRLLSSF